MRSIEEIKAATAKLDPDEQVELFRWWVDTESFKQRQLAALKRDIALGIDDLEQGRYVSYDDTSGMRLAEEIGKSGRERLKRGAKSRKA